MSDADGANGSGKQTAYPRIRQAIGLVVVAMVLTVAFDIPVWIVTRPHTAVRSVGTEIVHAFAMALVVRLLARRRSSGRALDRNGSLADAEMAGASHGLTVGNSLEDRGLRPRGVFA